MSKRRFFFYSGDINIEHGGFFYALDTWKDGYVDVVRVTPASDAGGPDNVFWIDVLTVNIPKGEKLKEALESCGWLSGDQGVMYNKMTLAKRKHVIVESCVMTGVYDQHSSQMIRIGPPDPFHVKSKDKEWDAPIKYRANVSLRNLAREKCRTDC